MRERARGTLKSHSHAEPCGSWRIASWMEKIGFYPAGDLSRWRMIRGWRLTTTSWCSNLWNAIPERLLARVLLRDLRAFSRVGVRVRGVPDRMKESSGIGNGGALWSDSGVWSQRSLSCHLRRLLTSRSSLFASERVFCKLRRATRGLVTLCASTLSHLLFTESKKEGDSCSFHYGVPNTHPAESPRHRRRHHRRRPPRCRCRSRRRYLRRPDYGR